MTERDIEGLIQSLAHTSVGKKGALVFEGEDSIWNTAEDVGHILKAMADSSDLNTLRIGRCSMSKEAAKAIAKALEKHPEFERARFSDMFTSRSKEEIPEALTYMSSGMMLAGAHLAELDLSDNALGPNGMRGLTELLKSSVCYSLKELRLHNTGLGPTGTKMLAECLDRCYEASVGTGKPMGLQVFVAGRSRLENEGCTALAKVFQKMGTLVEIQIKQNGIHHLGISVLAQALKSNPHMVHLNVNDNTLTEVGAKALSDVLPSLKSIEILDCGDCLIRSGGAKLFAKAVRKLDKLKKLTFSYNELNRDGAVELVKSVSELKQLEQLDLDGNQIGDDGIAAIERRIQEAGIPEDVVTMNEDEGSGDEDEEGGEEEEPKEDDDGEEIDDPQLQIHGIGLTPREKEMPFSVEMCEERVGRCIHLSLKISDPETKDAHKIYSLADELMKSIVDATGANEDLVQPLLTNSLLVHLGLLKSEDKKFEAPKNINGPLYLLNHVVQQKYFPTQARKTLQHFVGNPSPKWSHTSDSRKRLLETLYKY